MFRNRFWICLVLTIPVLAYAEGLWDLVGVRAPDLPGGKYVSFVLGTVIYVYGGSVFLRSATGRSPFDVHWSDTRLRLDLLEALKRLYRWEQTSGKYGQIDPFGISLIVGRTEAEIREMLADLQGEGLIENSSAATFGQTATEGWARITAAGRQELREGADDTAAWRDASVVMTDVVGSTSIANELGGDDFGARLRDEHDATARTIAAKFGGRFVKSTGDGSLLEFDGSEQAVSFASEFVETMRLRGIMVRAGVHRGPIRSFDNGDIGVLTVALATRVMAANESAGVLISEAAWRDLNRPDPFVLYGEVGLRGFPGTHKLYRLTRDHGS